jgi:hypothetical protein
MIALYHVDLDPRHAGSAQFPISTTYMPVGEGESTVPSTRSKPTSRCGHYEQVKVGTKWKCAGCGLILTISESIQNSIELSEVMRTAVESRVPLSESLDVLLGHREWEEIREKIPPAGGSSTRRLRRRRGINRKSAS